MLLQGKADDGGDEGVSVLTIEKQQVLKRLMEGRRSRRV